jgi:hypothetical protein
MAMARGTSRAAVLSVLALAVLALLSVAPASAAPDCKSISDCGACAANSTWKCVWCADSGDEPWKGGKCQDPSATCESRSSCTGDSCALVCVEPCFNEVWPCRFVHLFSVSPVPVPVVVSLESGCFLWFLRAHNVFPRL